MSSLDLYLSWSEEERQRRRYEVDAAGWRLEDHQAALRLTAAILRRSDERKAQAS